MNYNKSQTIEKVRQFKDALKNTLKDQEKMREQKNNIKSIKTGTKR